MKSFVEQTFIALLFAAALAFQSMIQCMTAQAPESRIPSLIAQLKLSGGQKKKLEPMYEENARKIEAIREDASLSDQEKRARTRDINEATIKVLGQTLTEKQRAKLKELRKKP